MSTSDDKRAAHDGGVCPEGVSAQPAGSQFSRDDADFAERINGLIRVLQNCRDPKERQAAAISLGDLPVKLIQEALGTAVYDDDEQVAVAAVNGLVSIHSPSPAPQLLALLGSPSLAVRHSCCIHLVELRHVTPQVIETIESLMTEESDSMVRSSQTTLISRTLPELLEIATEIYSSSAKVQLKFSM